MIRLITIMKYNLICRHLRAPTGTPHAVVGGADVTQTMESGVVAWCQMQVLTSVSSRSLFTHQPSRSAGRGVCLLKSWQHTSSSASSRMSCLDIFFVWNFVKHWQQDIGSLPNSKDFLRNTLTFLDKTSGLRLVLGCFRHLQKIVTRLPSRFGLSLLCLKRQRSPQKVT